jgi:hypothetical protein
MPSGKGYDEKGWGADAIGKTTTLPLRFAQCFFAATSAKNMRFFKQK